MAVLSIGDAGRDVFAYDESVDGPMSLVGEGSIGDALVLMAGNALRPQPPGGGGSVGDVSRNGASIDNRIARWHGTNAEVQNSVVTINDSGDISGVGHLTLLGLLVSGSGPTTLTTVVGLLKHEAIDPDIAGSGLSVASGVLSVDAHAPAAHTIASHDTNATGAELNTLRGGGNADALHSHTAGSLGGSGTIDTIAKWTGAATLGDSLITESGSVVSVGGDAVVSGKLGINTTPAANVVLDVQLTLLTHTIIFRKDNVVSTAPTLQVIQDNATGGVEALLIKQNLVGAGFINFEGSERGVISSGTSSTKSIRVEFNGVVGRLAWYADA